MAGRSGADNVQFTPDTWAIKTSVPFIGGRDQRYFQCGTSINNKGYIIAGSNGSTNWRNADEYSLNEDVWVSKTDMPAPTRANSACTTVLNKGYVFSGNNGASRYSDNDEYYPDSWTAKTNVPTIVVAATSTTILNKA